MLITLDIPQDKYYIIEQAAKLQGFSIEQFIVNCAYEKALELMNKNPIKNKDSN